jgi:type II secretory ATPase GspE/PulE/Tfp pilus assembly ATPase PilB-like protein
MAYNPLPSETNVRFRELGDFEIDRGVAAMLPVEFCLDKGVVILGRVPADPRAPIEIGMIQPKDEDVLAELRRRLGRPVTPVQLNAFEVRGAISRIFDVKLGGETGEVVAIDASRRIEFAAEQSPRKLLEDLLSTAVRRRASDIHIESYQNDVDLRFRVDGVLHQVTTPLSPDNVKRVLSRIKVLCNLDLTEHRRAQDGRFSVLFQEEIARRRIDFRVSIVPGSYGEDAVLRVLDPDRFVLDAERLEMPADILRRVRRLFQTPGGLLLSCGPTNSGKTTSLYASIQELRKRGLKIVTTEDPVEYEFPKVNQKNVTESMGFADHLKSFLRQNPDVILVGEIRDVETAEIAIRAATTGHLVLSTIHTSDAVGAVGRLRVLGISDDHLSDVLRGSLGQRLVRRICTGCRIEVAPPRELVDSFYRTPPTQPFFKGTGCNACAGTGYAGRVGVYELFQPEENLRAAMAGGRPVEELRRLARDHGYVPLVEDALRKAEVGTTSLEEVARCVGPKY